MHIWSAGSRTASSKGTEQGKICSIVGVLLFRDTPQMHTWIRECSGFGHDARMVM